MRWGRIYDSEFQAGKLCDFLCVNLFRCFTGTVSSGNKWFSYVFALAEALVISQKLLPKKGQRWREHQLYKSLYPWWFAHILQLRKSLCGVGVYSHTMGLSGILGKESQAFCLWIWTKADCPNCWWQLWISLRMSRGWIKWRKGENQSSKPWVSILITHTCSLTILLTSS